MKKNLTKIVVVFMALICSFVLSASVFASTQDFYIEDFTADYYLTTTEDGTSKLHVKEVITAVFPETDQNHGITRTIPFLNQAGKNRTVKGRAALGFSALRNGEVENVAKISEDDSVFTIYLGKSSEYVHGRQVYTLEYDFTNVIVDFDAEGNNVSGKSGVAQAFQELYWDTNGTGWSQKFGKVTASLHIDAAIMPKLKPETWCYVGKYGEKGEGRCATLKNEDGFTFSTESLSAGENLTFVVQFDPETFVVPVERTYILVWAVAIEAVIAAIILIRKFLRWRKTAKPAHDTYKETFVVPQYLPPEDQRIHVAEAEQLYLKGTKKSYVATLLELAVAKKVTIFRTAKENRPKKKIWVVKLNVSATELSYPQRRMLEILNGGVTPAEGEEVTIKKRNASQRSADCVRRYSSDAKSTLRQHGYINDDRLTRKSSSAVKLVLIMLVVPLMTYGLAFGSRIIANIVDRWDSIDVVGRDFLPLTMGVIFVVTLMAVVILSARTEKYAMYTDRGVEMVRYLEGLELYIKMAEQERLRFLQSVEGADTTKEGIVKLYETLLPWASLFGAEESWLKELGRYYQVEEVAPSFGTDFMDGFTSGAIASGVMRSVYSSSSYHAPSSGGFSRGGWSSSDSGGSGSSSSSGGGSSGGSGGGGGGGGGGGW